MSSKEEIALEDITGSKGEFNYYFYIFLLILLIGLHSLHVFLVEPSFTFSKYFFLMYSSAQCILEMVVVVSTLITLQLYFPSRLKHFFLFALYLLIISHFIDFFLERLIDISIWYGIGFITEEKLSNFFEMLKATNIPLSSWLVGLLSLAALFFIGRLFYAGCNILSKKKPIFFSRRLALSLGVASVCFILSWDFIFSPFIHDALAKQYQKALPWKKTLFAPKPEVFLVDGYLKDPWKQQDCFANMDSRPFSLSRKPDIFLFIAESLREDFITREITPHLAEFKQQSIHFPTALSNANATHISWFSIFYSLFPFHFPNFHKDLWQKGSIPLVLLKKMGYEIHLHSASRLSFYQMDEMIFGKDLYLLDSKNCYASSQKIAPWQADAQAIDGLIHDLDKAERPGGRVFIIFLDSTHFGYSWPDEMNIPFSPIDEKINYLHAAVSSKNLEKIKNRYRNSLYYVDSLFGKFLTQLKQSAAWKDSILVFTGDHGEEFYEQGHLFHATDLSKQQIHIPLYYKLGSGEVHSSTREVRISSHMDIFPSILHYLVGEDCFQEVLQGQSIFGQKKPTYAVGARYNAGRAPYEFYLHDGDQKIIAQFENKEDIFHSRAIHILSAQNDDGESIPYTSSIVHQYFGEALKNLFSP
ncbi:MAG: hypothetical protein EBZ47_01130 [Chlamydiae bacterium]|nr:hypothetical protein [Chlamydiota bacterium]